MGQMLFQVRNTALASNPSADALRLGIFSSAELCACGDPADSHHRGFKCCVRSFLCLSPTCKVRKVPHGSVGWGSVLSRLWLGLLLWYGFDRWSRELLHAEGGAEKKKKKNKLQRAWIMHQLHDWSEDSSKVVLPKACFYFHLWGRKGCNRYIV